MKIVKQYYSRYNWAILHIKESNWGIMGYEHDSFLIDVCLWDMKVNGRCGKPLLFCNPKILSFLEKQYNSWHWGHSFASFHVGVFAPSPLPWLWPLFCSTKILFLRRKKKNPKSIIKKMKKEESAWVLAPTKKSPLFFWAWRKNKSSAPGFAKPITTDFVLNN